MTQMTAAVEFNLGSGVHARVYESEAATGTWAISWDDGVANSWSEYYDSLPEALTRLATLAYCVETDRVFAQVEEREFSVVASQFLSETTQKAF